MGPGQSTDSIDDVKGVIDQLKHCRIRKKKIDQYYFENVGWVDICDSHRICGVSRREGEDRERRRGRKRERERERERETETETETERKTETEIERQSDTERQKDRQNRWQTDGKRGVGEREGWGRESRGGGEGHTQRQTDRQADREREKERERESESKRETERNRDRNRKIKGGGNSSVGCVLGSLACIMQHWGFNPDQSHLVDAFSLGVNMGSDSIPLKHSFRWEYKSKAQSVLTCIPSHGLKRRWYSCPRLVNAGNKKTPSMYHPRRRKTSMAGSKNSHICKISPKMVNPRDWARNTEHEEKKKEREKLSHNRQAETENLELTPTEKLELTPRLAQASLWSFSFSFSSRWHRSTRKGPYALRPVS